MFEQIPPEIKANIVAAGTWLWAEYGTKLIDKVADRVKKEKDWIFGIKNYYTSLYDRVGFVRILGRSESEQLENVFTHVNVLDQPSAERRYDISRMLDEFGPRDFTSHKGIERVPGDDALAQFPKLFIFGKPGAGKTTFLKHTALRAINQDIKEVPIFVSLKELSDSEMEIVPFITHQFEVHGFPNPGPFVEELLKDGNALVLFDGLDEVNLADDQRATMIRQLNDFVYQYGNCPIVITCRVAATDYSFTQFYYVEMADFDEGQIGCYIDQWFVDDDSKCKGCRTALLENPDNVAVRELASVPLLLSLLCLVYEERNEIPLERDEIYDEAIQALLSKWDASRNIARDTVYQQLTRKRKQDLLSQLAERNFEDGVYFMKERDITRQIEQYLAGVPGLEEPDGEIVLQSMEAQHGILVERARGIHSFSHLTLQEYFTARYIVDDVSRSAVDEMLSHVGDDRWREVFLLVAGMLSEATAFCEGYLEATRKLVVEDNDLVALLSWAAQKADRLDVGYKPAAARTFLLFRGLALASTRARKMALHRDDPQDLTLSRDLTRARAFARDLSRNLDHDLDRAVDLARDLDLDVARELELNRDLDFGEAYRTSMELAEGLRVDGLIADLRALGEPLKLEEGKDAEALILWAQRFSELLEPTRDLWEPARQMVVSKEEEVLSSRLTNEQVVRLVQYLEANVILERCLRVAYVTDRAGIEERMLLSPGY